MQDEQRLVGIKWSNGTLRALNNKHVLLNRKFVCLVSAELLLYLICIIGDHYVFTSNTLIKYLSKRMMLSEQLIRALLDSFTHATIGFISWFIISYPNLDMLELVMSAFFASVIDIDHFISAKSLHINDAISLSKRPFFHNSLTLTILNILLYLIIGYLDASKKHWAVLIFISWFSHHARDAHRRGLWFGPIGTTNPLTDSVYLLTILGLPLILKYTVESSILGLNVFSRARRLNKTLFIV